MTLALIALLGLTVATLTIASRRDEPEAKPVRVRVEERRPRR